MADLEALITRHDIECVLIQFARAMDARDWPALLEILTPDATADFGQGIVESPQAIVGVIRSYLETCGPTQHLLGNLLVERDGDQAKSCCYVSDTHLGGGAGAHLTFCTLGDYHDVWRRMDGRWRLAQRRKYNHGFVGTMDVFTRSA